jgi:hypothetical protein
MVREDPAPRAACRHRWLAWILGTSGTFYEDPGGDYFTRLNPERARTRAIRQLESLGYAVTLAGTGAS